MVGKGTPFGMGDVNNHAIRPIQLKNLVTDCATEIKNNARMVRRIPYAGIIHKNRRCRLQGKKKQRCKQQKKRSY